MTNWDIDAQFSTSIYIDDDNHVYDENGDIFESTCCGAKLWARMRWYHVERSRLVVFFNSTGSYDLGVYSGPPESCYPDDYQDERTVLNCWLVIDDEIVHLPDYMNNDFFDRYSDEIYEIELDMYEI